MIFKTTYPVGYIKPKEVVNNPSDPYPALAQKNDTLNPIRKFICVAKSVQPDEVGQPVKMVTLGEMLRIRDRVDVELYQRLIAIKYLNA